MLFLEKFDYITLISKIECISYQITQKITWITRMLVLTTCQPFKCIIWQIANSILFPISDQCHFTASCILQCYMQTVRHNLY